MRIGVELWPPVLPVRAGCALIVDVLRATTTLTVALEHGARAVVPAATPADALALRARHAGSLACGERAGRIVPGFDLGNSPFEYTPERVAGRTLVFASTNGSQAMLATRAARRRVLASFVNAAAVVEAVRSEREVTIVCAGKLGGFSLEDAACAGLLLARLERHGGEASGPAARLARTLAPRDADEVRTLVAGAAHARYLAAMGPEFARDVEFCGGLDTVGRAFELGEPSR